LFERLANELLRKKFPHAANLIASGINEQGKPVKGASDGFFLSGQDHYATIHHTTQANLQKIGCMTDLQEKLSKAIS